MKSAAALVVLATLAGCRTWGNPPPLPPAQPATGRASEPTQTAGPSAPELGATPREAAAICQLQGGAVETAPPYDFARCVLESETLFTVDVRNGVVFRVDLYLAGADAIEARDMARREFGEPAEVTVDEAGFRVWVWYSASRAFGVRMYERGTILTEIAR